MYQSFAPKRQYAEFLRTLIAADIPTVLSPSSDEEEGGP